jgi:hypothetical protein
MLIRLIQIALSEALDFEGKWCNYIDVLNLVPLQEGGKANDIQFFLKSTLFFLGILKIYFPLYFYPA